MTPAAVAPGAPWSPAEVSENDLKLRFARFLFKIPDSPGNRMLAAQQIYPLQGQLGLAATIARDWPDDPVVRNELVRLGSAGTEDGLPTKADVARRYLVIADDSSKPLKDRLTALDKYAELQGMKPQAGQLGVNVTVDNRRVFVLPAAAPNLVEWEKGAVKQQAKLIESSAVHRE